MWKRISIFLFALSCLTSFSAIAQSSPSDISGLAFWLNADSVVDVDVDGNVLSAPDLSGSGHSATSPIPQSRPLLVSSAVNGHAALQFDGADDHLIFPAIDSMRTIFWVVKENSAATSDYPPRSLFSSSTNSQLFYRGSARAIFYPWPDNPVSNGITKLNFNPVNAATEILPFDYCIISCQTTDIAAADKFSQTLGIWGFFWWGEMAEIIAYNRPLSNAEISQVEDYLIQKFAPPSPNDQDLFFTDTFCPQEICAPDGFSSYRWSNGTFEQCITVSQSQTLSLAVTDRFGRNHQANYQIHFPELQAPPTSAVICGDQPFQWASNLEADLVSIAWNDTLLDSVMITESDPGLYHWIVSDNFGCEVDGTVELISDPFSSLFSLGNDTSLCSGDAISAVSGSENVATWLWSDLSNSPTFMVSTSETISVQATDVLGCLAYDTISVNIVGQGASVQLIIPDFCPSLANSVSYNLIGGNPSNWQWSINGEPAGNQPFLETTFNSPGNYPISLKITDQNNCNAVFFDTIFVLNPPLTYFTYSDPCTNTIINFNNQSESSYGGELQTYWFVENTSAESFNFSWSSDTSGIFTVQLTTSEIGGCSSTFSANIIVLPSPTAILSAENTCLGNLASFSSQSNPNGSGIINSFEWSFGDGTGASNPEAIHYFAVADSFLVSLAVGAQNGCSDTSYKWIQIFEPPQALFDSLVVCENTPFTPNNASVSDLRDPITEWNWNFNGQLFNTETPEIIAQNASPSFLSLQVVTAAGCSNSFTRNIDIGSLPSSSFTFGINPASDYSVWLSANNDPGLQAEWSFGSSATDTVITLQIDTLLLVGLHAESQFGCFSSTYEEIHFQKRLLDLKVDHLTYTLENGWLTPMLEILNVGNIPVSSAFLSWQLQGSLPISQTRNQPLNPGEAAWFSFNASFPAGSSASELLCAQIEALNLPLVDSNPENNEVCLDLTGGNSRIVAIYPNPASEFVHLEFIAKELGPLSLQIRSTDGRSVLQRTWKLQEAGFGRFQIPIDGLSAGEYSVCLTFTDGLVCNRFIKLGH
jgi:hypothetical protein